MTTRPLSERLASRKFLIAVIVLLLAFVLFALGRIDWSGFLWLVGPVVSVYLAAEGLADSRR